MASSLVVGAAHAQQLLGPPPTTWALGIQREYSRISSVVTYALHHVGDRPTFPHARRVLDTVKGSLTSLDRINILQALRNIREEQGKPPKAPRLR